MKITELDNLKHSLRRYRIMIDKIDHLQARSKEPQNSANKEEYKERINRLKEKATVYKREVTKEIHRIEDPLIVQILEARYIQGDSANQIAKDIGYSTRSIFRLQAVGLNLLLSDQASGKDEA